MIEAVKSAIPLRPYLAENGIEGKSNLYRCIGRDHEDRNPSGWIYQGRGGYERFRCGSCGLDVDIIGAAQELHGLDLKGALRLLADRAGIMRQTSTEAKAAQRERERKQELLRAFREWEQTTVNEISAVLRVYRRMRATKTTYTEAELIELARVQGHIDYLEYIYEDILCHRNDEPKFRLYQEMAYAGN